MTLKVYDSNNKELGWVDYYKCTVYYQNGIEVGQIDLAKEGCKDITGKFVGRVRIISADIEDWDTRSVLGSLDMFRNIYDNLGRIIGKTSLDLFELDRLAQMDYFVPRNLYSYPLFLYRVYAGCAARLLLLK